ncbi:MAG: hypothetical protein HY779_00465 [Rubrobacteridae bacterium]|nr:hypothetical protein [Rubrobacteridae bacterium]
MSNSAGAVCGHYRSRAYLLIAMALFIASVFFLIIANVCKAAQAEAIQTYEGTNIVLRAADDNARLFESLKTVPEKIFEEMASRYHYRQTKKIVLFVYSDPEKFYENSPSRDAIGYAIPAENKIAILLNGNLAGLQTTIAHEINHIIFINSTPRINTVPQWFIEGLAIYESHPGSNAGNIEEQALAQDLPDIICLRPDSAAAEPKDYGQGYLLVGYIVREFGRDALDGIIVKLQSGIDFNSAVLETLNVSPEELNENSKESVGIDLVYVWLLKLQNLEWYLATVLFIVAGTIAYVKKRRGLSGANDDPDNTGASSESDDDLNSDDENEFEGVDFGDGAIV